MGIAEYEVAVTLMSTHAELRDFLGPRSEELVEAGEKKLGLRFAPSYRRFLLEQGAGSFGSSEVFGIIDSNFDHSSVPDCIWYTLREREESGMSTALIVVFNDGRGDLFCLDCTQEGADFESPLVRFQPGISARDSRRERIASDFGSFLLDLVEREIAARRR